VDARSVQTRADLVRYLAELSESVRVGELRVENASAADLLEAASAWVDAMDGYFINRNEPIPQSPDWALVASIFSAALVYE
jgi:predicted metal-binding protein